MANTFSQIYIQTVFAVSNRMSPITPEFKEDLHKYITGIVRNQGQKLISINGMADHLHLDRSQALDGAGGLGKGRQSRVVNLRKQKQMGSRKVFVAGGVRRILIRTFPTGHDHSVYPKSGKASPAKVVQGRVFGVAQEV